MNFKMMILALFVVAATAYVNPSPAQLQANDINAMRYALTLENLELAFYNQMQQKFSAADFQTAGLGAATYATLGLIQAHEQAHVNFIVNTMAALGIAAPAACTYNFASITTVQQYIAAAALFETTGVSAYDGAINTVFNSTVVQALATIATIEARHSSYLNGLNASMPVLPATQFLDVALAPATVGAAISTFLSCPGQNITSYYPQALVVVPIVNTTDPTLFTITTNDINALNYALFLENLEAAFYNVGQQRFSDADFVNAGFNASVRANIGLIQAHENAHVTFLNQAITAAQGTPVPACTYNFGNLVTDVRSYIAIAAALETTGVSAYDGAVNTIYNGAYKQAAATIATVEARHSSYLNALNASMPVPASNVAFDTAILPAGIVAAVTQLNVITSCPGNFQASLPLPRVLTLSAASNTTATTGTTTGTTTGRTTSASTSTSAASAVPVAAGLVFASALLALF